MPDIYLALDLDGTEDALAAMPDATLFAARGAGDVIALEQVQGEGWTRNWRAWPGTPEGKAAATEYARKHPTIVVIPLDTETVPLEQMQ